MTIAALYTANDVASKYQSICLTRLMWGLSTCKVFAYISDTCQSLFYYHYCWCYYFIFVHFNCFCTIVVYYSSFCSYNRGGTGWVSDSIMQMKLIQRWAEIHPSPSEPGLAQSLLAIPSQAISHNPGTLPPTGQPSFLPQWFPGHLSLFCARHNHYVGLRTKVMTNNIFFPDLEGLPIYWERQKSTDGTDRSESPMKYTKTAPNKTPSLALGRSGRASSRRGLQSSYLTNYLQKRVTSHNVSYLQSQRFTYSLIHSVTQFICWTPIDPKHHSRRW